MTDKTPLLPTGRRSFLGAALAVSALPRLAAAGERDWSGRTPTRYPEPDVEVLDPRFARYRIGNTPIQRLHTGMLWAEGPAWNPVGRYLVWSDIPNDVQLRWLEEDGHVSVLRRPSGNSNGNYFDRQGRQLSCEHANRRVVRYEHDGTRHGAGRALERQAAQRAERRGRSTPTAASGSPTRATAAWATTRDTRAPSRSRRRSTASTRRRARSTLVTDALGKPNGLCFSPDQKRLYVADTGGGPTHGIQVFDVVDGQRLANGRSFTSMEFRGKTGGADGIRCDIDGNVWAGAGWVGDGYDGVHVFAPDGTRIGLIKLPEICANVCFGGAKRNRLFMAASQSLYAVYTGAQGAV